MQLPGRLRGVALLVLLVTTLARGGALPRSCSSGKSKIQLVYASKLLPPCLPLPHDYAHLAVLECFSSWKVKVKRCSIRLRPETKHSKSGLRCDFFGAVGNLTGSSSATLEGVWDRQGMLEYLNTTPQVVAHLSGHKAATLKHLMHGIEAALAKFFPSQTLITQASRVSALLLEDTDTDMSSIDTVDTSQPVSCTGGRRLLADLMRATQQLQALDHERRGAHPFLPAESLEEGFEPQAEGDDPVEPRSAFWRRSRLLDVYLKPLNGCTYQYQITSGRKLLLPEGWLPGPDPHHPAASRLLGWCALVFGPAALTTALLFLLAKRLAERSTRRMEAAKEAEADVLRQSLLRVRSQSSLGSPDSGAAPQPAAAAAVAAPAGAP